MNRNDAHDHNYGAGKPGSEYRKIGNGPVRPKYPADISEAVTLTNSETAEAVTIPLADVGVDVPATATVDVRITTRGLAVDRRGETFEVERDGDGWILAGVVGRSELPERVPAWLEPVVEWFGVEEVRLGR